jgi:hypothetical protein
LCHEVLGDARLYALLLKYDEDLAAEARVAGCECGGVLHVSDFPRKPRGGPAGLGAEHERRLSFCCDREGCRGRVTPRSVRFLGRRVYLGAVVVLVSAMVNGPTPRRVAKLVLLIGASRRTLERWRAWWRTAFAESAFWKAAAGRFAAPVARRFLPWSLLDRFEGDERERLVAALRFLSPITSNSARNAMAS